jgi:DNA polymerase-3 subunit beta
LVTTIVMPAADLRRAAGWVRPTVSGGPPLELLSAVRVSIVGGHLILAGFDYETMTMARTPGVVTDDGGPVSALVPGGALLGMIGATPTSRKAGVEITVTNGVQVDLTYGTGTSRARTGVPQFADISGYPALPGLPPVTGSIPGPAFTSAAARIAGMAATTGELPVLCCVNFACGPESVTLQGTDKYRAGINELTWAQGGAAVAQQVLLPGKAVARFAAAVTTDPVYFCVPAGRDTWAALTDGHRTLILRPVTGDYPKVATLTGKYSKTVTAVTVDALALREALAAAESAGVLLTDKYGNKYKAVTLTAAEGTVTVSGTNADGLAGTWTAEATLDGEPGGKLVNPGYLQSLLAGLAGPVTVQWGAGPVPLMVTCPGTAPGYLAMVMPIRENDHQAVVEKETAGV